MAGSEEIDVLVTQIRELLPNLTVTRDDILNPSHEFVKSFSEHALNYYDSKIGFVIKGEETPPVRNSEAYYTSLGYGPETVLFVRIKKILKEICIIPFSISDFYRPQKQRTKAFLQMMINFLCFVEGPLEGAREIVETLAETRADVNKLEQERKKLLEKCNEKILENAREEEVHKALKSGMV